MPTLLGIGSDIESVSVAGLNKVPVSLLGDMPGTKTDPHPLSNGGAVQMDGVLVEYNLPVSHSPDEFCFNLLQTQLLVREMVNKRGLSLEHTASASFDLKELEHPDACHIGCEGDYNAWDGQPNIGIDYRPQAKHKFNSGLRTMGGHLHFSFQQGGSLNAAKPTVFQIVRQLDYYIGLRTLLYDFDNTRRLIYGAAGACRVKRYPDGTVGGEYRVPSSMWAKPEFMGEKANEFFSLVQYVVQNLDKLPEPPEGVQEVINTGDHSAALSFLAKQDK